MRTFEQLVKRVLLSLQFSALRAILKRWKIVHQWRSRGSPAPPPPEVKHATIREYSKKFGLEILIETGTLFGDTIAATRRHFSDIYSIELSPELHARAKQRFANDPNVHLLLGDSGEVLKDILAEILRPPLFWLDAHYSGGPTVRGKEDTPIVQELETILALSPDCVALIDDARLFDGANSYPTLAELKQRVAARAPHLVVEVKDDIIRLHPRPS
jgi:hypothetical protein